MRSSKKGLFLALFLGRHVKKSIMYYDIAFCQLKTPIILDDPKVTRD